MAAVALDLTPVVDALLAQPFDRSTLDGAYAAVGGRPQAFATALRCAAKRAPDAATAAYWYIEAARVHESVDDLGGCIALLARAWESDPGNDRARELLSASMARLATRTGLGFTFAARESAPPESAPSADAAPRRRTATRPPPVESGMRPPPQARPPQDTLPDLFGMDRTDAEVDFDALLEKPEPEHASPASAAVEPSARVAPMLPPKLVPARPSAIPRDGSRDELGLLAIADMATQTRRSAELGSRRALHVVPDPPPSGTALTAKAPTAPPPADARDELAGARTERPQGDHLTGALFEALHELHFSSDVREGAAFVQRVLRETMRASTVLVHVYDINSRHFVVMGVHASRSAALVDYATPEDDVLVAELMKSTEATLFTAPGSDARFSRGRWLLVEPQRSVLCAPATVEGRYLGLVELADPEDGAEFGEDDRHALTYAANAFARFLAHRGIVLSTEPDEALTP